MRTTLRLRNHYHRSLENIAFVYGVPVPEHVAKGPESFALLDSGGEPVPLTAQPMATWPDGSVRWALLEFAGDFAPNEASSWTLAIGEGLPRPAPLAPVIVEEDQDGVCVANGCLVATFRRDAFRVFGTLEADGVSIITAACRCDIVAASEHGKLFRASCDPSPRLSVEESSPLRAVVRWDGGLFAGDGERMTEYRLKLTFTAGSGCVGVEHSAVCREQPELGVQMREYRLDLETVMNRKTTKTVRQKTHGVDNFSRLVALDQNVRIKVPTTQEGTSQDGWAVGTLGTAGKCLLEDESAFGETTSDFPHFLRPNAPRVALGGGYAVVFPFLGVRDGARTLVASFLRMAPQYPKGIHADENRLSFEVWPVGNGLWRLSRGMTKTHHLAWSFFGRTLTDEETDGEALRREFFAGDLHEPVSVQLDPVYVRETQQVEAHTLLPFLPARYPKLEAKLAGISLHGKPLAHSGMMDYGEAIATNNEEDQGHEYAMEYYRSGSIASFRKLVAQMLHNSTVDVVDWDPDPLRAGGTPYHTGYHQDAVCVPSHTWTEGMFEYAYVSGDREAFRAAVGICEWILRYMKGKPQIVRQDGRETGWPIIALVAGYRATWDSRYLEGANRLVELYREKIAQHGEVGNEEPPGTGYCLEGYGEYACFEGMHKLWQVTGDADLRALALSMLEQFLDRGHVEFHSHGRMMDLYAVYAAYDMSRDPKWLETAKRLLPIALARPDWDGYFYRRIIHFLGLCHEHGFIDDALVALKG